MANLLSQGGIFNSGSTWNTVTNFIGSNVSWTDLFTGTTYQSTNFIPGAITVKGVVLWLYYNGSVNNPNNTGVTMTVTLRNTTSNIDVSTMTVPLQYLPYIPEQRRAGTELGGVGWSYFEFMSASTLSATTNYAIRVSCDRDRYVGLFGNVTTFSRGMVTTTNAAPVASDVLLITGKYTSTGATNPTTIINTNATTAFSTIYISGAELIFTATTSTQLRTSSNIFISRNGAVRMGTPEEPIASGRTAQILNTTTGIADFGIIVNGGELTTYGRPKTNWVEGTTTAGNTTLNLSQPTFNWDPGDTIVITSISKDPRETEEETISTVNSPSQVTITSPVTFNHSSVSSFGTPHVANLTRNVRIGLSAPSTTRSMVIVSAGYYSVLDLNNTQITNVGATAANPGPFTNINYPQGLEIGYSSTSSFFKMSGCSYYSLNANLLPNSYGIGYAGTVMAGCVYGSCTPTDVLYHTFQDNVVYNGGSFPYTMTYQDKQKEPPTFKNNIFIRCGTVNIQDAGVYDTSATGTDSFNNLNNVICCSRETPALSLNLDKDTVKSGNYNSMDNWRIYSNSGSTLTNPIVKIYSEDTLNTGLRPIANVNVTGWRVFNNAQSDAGAVNFDNFLIGDYRSCFTPVVWVMGNNGRSHISLGSNIYTKLFFYDGWFTGPTSGVNSGSTDYFVDSSINGVPGYSNFLNNNGIYFYRVRLNRDILGNTKPFTLAPFNLELLSGRNIIVEPRGNNVTPTNLVWRDNSSNAGAQVRSVTTPSIIAYRISGVTNNDYIYYPSYTVFKDFGTPYSGASYSLRITPASYSNVSATPSPLVRVPVRSGQTCTISAYVRKTSYSGAQPRLIYVSNPIVGNIDRLNITGATMTVGNSVWQTLTYTTPAATYDGTMEFFIESAPTGGYINIGGWNTSLNVDTRTDPVWSSLLGTYSEPDFLPATTGGTTSQSSYTFIG